MRLDEALKSLAEMDPRRSQVVELRYFGGLNNEEIAGVLKVSENTVTRDWNMARAWLYQQLGGSAAELTPERWQQISRIFKSAISLDGEARVNYVARTVWR